MWAGLLRFIGVSESTASFVDYLLRILVWLGILGGGGMTAVSIYTSQLYNDYGYAALVAGFLLGSLILAAAAALAASAYRRFKEGQLYRALAQKQSGFNPKSDNYSDEVFNVADMFHPMSHVLDQKTFHNCDFIGPGVILFDGHINLVGGGDFVECGDLIFAPGGTAVTSVLVLRNCTFRNCRFFRVGLLTSSPGVIDGFVSFGARDPRLFGAVALPGAAKEGA